MPQIQILPAVDREVKEDNSLGGVISRLASEARGRQDNSKIKELYSEYEQNMNDENAYEKLMFGLQKSDISPSKRLEAQQQLAAMGESVNARKQAFAAKVKKGVLTGEDRERAVQLQEERGMPRYEAEAHVDGPPSVKSQIERTHQDLINRGLRTPISKEGVPQQAPSGKAKEGAPVEGEENEPPEWPDLPTPKGINPAEKVKWENTNQKFNNEELKNTQDKKKMYRANEIDTRELQRLNESKKLPTSWDKLVTVDPEDGTLTPTSQLLGLNNKEAELYVKTINRWLKGAKEYFGGRVSNFEVSTFLTQLPTLANSEQGRRLILKQMEYANQLDQTYNSELNAALKHYGREANYSDILKTVDDRIQGREDELIHKLDRVTEASNYLDIAAKNPQKFKNTTLMESPKGDFKMVPNDRISDLPKGWIKY